MYDEPPDPEPSPCPFCDAELGCGEGCEHCAMADAQACLTVYRAIKAGQRERLPLATAA